MKRLIPILAFIPLIMVLLCGLVWLIQCAGIAAIETASNLPQWWKQPARELTKGEIILLIIAQYIFGLKRRSDHRQQKG